MHKLSGVKPYDCQDCNSSFKTPSELKRHTRYRHTYERPYKCTDCSYSAVEKSKLRRHMTIHSGEKPYQCPNCTQAFADNFKLKRHLRTHTGEKPYQCEICDSYFTQHSTLKSHLVQIHGKIKRQHKCHICYSLFPWTIALRTHIQKWHTTSEQQVCQKCDTIFKDMDKYSFTNHVKSHLTNKMCECEICPYKTWSEKDLTKHSNQHGNMFFNCSMCKNGYKTKSKLSHHKINSHPMYKSKNYKCNDCGRAYRTKKYLIRHLGVIHGHYERKVSKISELDNGIDYILFSSIKKSLNDGEVIVLPEKGKEKYVMIEVLPNNEDLFGPTSPIDANCTGKDMISKEFYVEIEDNKLEIKIEPKSDISDEESEPFFGF